MRIVVVEDSERLSRSLCLGLSREGHAVDAALDGEQALLSLQSADYDCVVLDLMLPKIDGLEVLRRLRAEGNDVHVLILSAKDEVADRVRGLELGADDYLVKPFAFEELSARLRALGRRLHSKKNPVLRLGDLTLDTSKLVVERDGEDIPLTPNEYRILEFLALRAGKTFSKDQLLEGIYSWASHVTPNAIEVTISHLRKKIDLEGSDSIIRTRRGYGYCIEASDP